ncbi:MAG: phosphogluconate dehydrogenase (NADP(+)-dependent, decarboxylating) [Anaerolineales bacterium]|nr:NADP-dependent phosphogluconate dehydrogenase [Anaerolineae bacterium]PWB54657.1 MAG: phosphogluconate dehydrogenase (NADP(+)-dependent, decarboxylating) [Anaerolineales bacterium]
MTEGNYRIGMVGLGVMGRNLLLNMAEHGFRVAGYDKDPEKVQLLSSAAGGLPIQSAKDVASFVSLLQVPRTIMLLVPAGPVVDNVIHDLLPYLQIEDTIIDAGNSHFTDTDIRETTLIAKGLHFFGMGVSGGEEGARYGPSMMPGGAQAAYQRVQDILEATAAHVNGTPCVTYLGPHSAGHYVKMVHNGIEYGIMQLIAETYDLLKRGGGLNDDALGELFSSWNAAELNSYLVEITADIFRKVDEVTGKRLVDVVLDAAHQLGTGMWTSQDAFSLHVPTPTIDTAVSMRNLSGMEYQRHAINQKFGSVVSQLPGDPKAIIKLARGGLYAAIILTYAQGFAQLEGASKAYQYNFDLSAVARIWKGGCIIRSKLLEFIQAAYQQNPGLMNLVLDPTLSGLVLEHIEELRGMVQAATGMGIPVPASMASLAYFDSLRSSHLPANLIQAQRDYFGAHTYERVDQRGIFHTQWTKEE